VLLAIGDLQAAFTLALVSRVSATDTRRNVIAPPASVRFVFAHFGLFHEQKGKTVKQ